MAFFSFERRFRVKGGDGAALALLVRRGVSFLFVFISGSSGLMEQVKGWRRFKIADAWAPFSPTCRPRSLAAREREPGRAGERVMSTRTGTLRKREADRSDVRQEYVRLERARTGFELKASGRAPALHALRVSHDPCLRDLSLRFSPCEADAAAFVGRVESAFHPATDERSVIQICCKGFSSKSFSEVAAPTMGMGKGGSDR